MKIKKLKMQAFGPYLEEVEIDFEKLTEKDGLFLLTGPTGVGKTSIFDAICFALYGETSVTTSSGEKIRSLFADENTKTFVELTYEVNGREYSIHREPTQRISSKRAVTEIKHNVSFQEKEGKCYTKVSEVKDAIEKTLGLTIDQFRQIVMIPQGEFVQLLTSSTKDKEEIFRRIFSTENIHAFQEILNKKFKDKSESLKDKEADIIKILNQSKISEDFLLNIQSANLEDKIEELNKYNEDCIGCFEELNNKKERIDKEINSCQEKINEINKTNEGVRNYRNALNDINNLDDSSYQEKKLKEDNYIYSKEIDSLHKNIKDCKDKIAEAKTNLKKNSESLEKLDKDKYEQLEKQKELTSKSNSIDQKKIERSDLENRLKELQDKRKILNEVESLEEKLNNLLSQIKVYEDKINANKDEIKTRTKESEEIEKSLENESSVRDNFYQMQSHLKQIKEDCKLFADLKDLKDSLNLKSKELLDLKNVYLDLERKANELESLYYGNTAYYIASKLKDGDVCPVCGSIYHSSEKTCIKCSVSIEEVNEARASQEKARENQIKCEVDIKSIEDNIHKKEEDISNKGYLDYEDYLKKLAVTTKGLNELQNKINLIKTSKEKNREIKQNIDKLQKDIEKCEEQVSNYKIDKEELTGKIHDKRGRIVGFKNEDEKELKANIENLKKDIDDYDLAVRNNNDMLQNINKEIARIQENNNTLGLSINENSDKIKEHEELIKDKSEKIVGDYKDFLMDEAEYNSLKTYLRDFEGKKAKIKGRLEEYDKFKDKEEKDVTPFQEDLDRLKKDKEENKTQYDLLENNYKTNLDVYKKVKDMFDTIQEDYKEVTRYKELSSIASGNNSKKLSFENYILSIFFDSCIEQANVIFKTMTNGRFELLRKEESSGNAQTGLELNVRDYHSGGTRSVKTLSGGESFKAALSLALGLAEIIGHRASGVEMNTMFIDEGFGSLDSESLDVAISVLTDIKNSGRSIGIISHVEELKKRIPTKVIIEETPQGSRIKSIIC